jgi:hypothetical protein
MKRTNLGCALALVAVTIAPEVVGGLPQAQAQAPGPSLTIAPKCVNNTTGSMSLTFTGNDFPDDSTVLIYDQDKPNKPPIAAGTNKSGDFTTPPVSMPAKPAGYYTFRAEVGSTRVYRGFKVPCPSISISPGCGPAGTQTATQTETYDILVTGKNFPPIIPETAGNTVRLTFDGAQIGPLVEVGGNDGASFSTTIKVPRKPAGSHTVAATDTRDSMVATALFFVPCLVIDSTTSTVTTAPPTETTVTTAPPPIVGPGPACVLDPPVGPPGFVAQARCARFPAATTATLRWSPGIGTVTAPTGSGAFSVPVLIFPRDQLGARNLVVEAPGASVLVPFIVVPPSVSPSGGDVATQFLPQLVRRY